MRRSWKTVLSVLLVGSFFGCSPKEKKYQIAIVLPLTGDLASLGQGLKRAAVLAFEQAKQDPALATLPIEVQTYDDRSDPKEAVDVANRIASNRSMLAVIGHFNSGCSIPASQVYAKAKLAMLTPGSSNPKLTLQQLDPSWKYVKNVFRVYSTDDIQGTYAGDYIRKTFKASRAVVIHDRTAYGQGVGDEFRKRFESLGGQVIAFDGISVADKDFNAVLTRIRELNPQAIFFGGDYAGGGLLLRQARAVGIKAPMVLSEANLDPELLRVAGPAAEGAYITFLGAPPELLPNAKKFIADYKQRYPTDEMKAYDHYGYEAMAIAMDALKRSGPDREKLIVELTKTNYNGVLGQMRFDEKGDNYNRVVTLFQVKDGKFVPVK